MGICQSLFPYWDPSMVKVIHLCQIPVWKRWSTFPYGDPQIHTWIPRATISEGNNRNCDDGKDACALTATTSAHRQRATTQPVMRRQRVERRRWRIVRQRRLKDKRRQRHDKWSVVSCNNQMAKKRSRQSRKAESLAGQQQGRRNNQLENREVSADKRQTGAEASADKRRWGLIGRGWAFRGGGRVERIRGGGINATTSRQTRDGDKSNGDSDDSMVVWYVRSVCTQKLARFGKKDILQCVTKWMAKNTAPATIWEVLVWNGGGRKKIAFGDSP